MTLNVLEQLNQTAPVGWILSSTVTSALSRHNVYKKPGNFTQLLTLFLSPTNYPPTHPSTTISLPLAILKPDQKHLDQILSGINVLYQYIDAHD